MRGERDNLELLSTSPDLHGASDFQPILLLSTTIFFKRKRVPLQVALIPTTDGFGFLCPASPNLRANSQPGFRRENEMNHKFFSSFILSLCPQFVDEFLVGSFLPSQVFMQVRMYHREFEVEI